MRILARTHSVTGLILVGEHVEEGFRFMRADHSLLGGRWVGKKAVTEAKDGLGDTIYATFVLQEAARLVKREKTQIKDERALFMYVWGYSVGHSELTVPVACAVGLVWGLQRKRSSHMTSTRPSLRSTPPCILMPVNILASHSRTMSISRTRANGCTVTPILAQVINLTLWYTIAFQVGEYRRTFSPLNFGSS